DADGSQSSLVRWDYYPATSYVRCNVRNRYTGALVAPMGSNLNNYPLPVITPTAEGKSATISLVEMLRDMGPGAYGMECKVGTYSTCLVKVDLREDEP